MRKLSKAASLLAGVSVSEMFYRFVRTKCIALFLDKSGTGFLAQLTLFFETLRVWGDMGTRRAMVKQIAEQKGADKSKSQTYREVVTTSFFLVAGVSCLISLGVTIFASLISKSIFGDTRYALFVMGMGWILPIASISTLVAAIMKGNLDFSAYTRYTVGSYLVTVIAIPFLIYFFGYWGSVVAQLMLFLCPLLGYLIFNRIKPFLFFSRKINGEILKEELVYSGAGLYGNTMARVSRLIVATWITKELGFDQMGLYQVVITFSTVYMTIPVQAISGYTLPIVAKAETQQEVVQAINDSVRYLVFVLAPVVIFILIWPDILIHIFFSKKFVAAAFILQLQLFGTMCNVFSAPFSTGLAAKGNIRALNIIATVSPLLYCFFSWFFFKRFGLAGVAAAFSISALVSGLWGYFCLKKDVKLNLYPKNMRLIIVTMLWYALAMAVGIFEGHSLALKFTAAALILPWFFISSKSHEREFLWAKVKSYIVRPKAKVS